MERLQRWKSYHSLRRRSKFTKAVYLPSQSSSQRSSSVHSFQSRSSKLSAVGLTASRSEKNDSQTDIDVPETQNRANKESTNSYSTKLCFPNEHHPLISRYGRRYMDRLPYFLPADLKELQRQSVLTSITSRIFGAPTCTPIDPLNPPRKILDFCCGDAYWTTLCHEYFCSLGIYHVQFTGIDIGHFAPDWKRYGINWNFVQHDARDFPLPFPDGHFDRVMISNCVFVFQNDISIFAKVMNEMHRLIAPGGFIEIRDSEYQVRRLVPNAKVPEGLTLEDKLIAQELGVYFTTDADDYAPCENQYMQDLNNWMFRFMEQTNNATDSVLQVQKVKELPGFEEIKSKVIAIPFSSPLIWEDPEDLRNDSIDLLHKRKYVSNTDRTALREAALQVIIDFAEALEPHLREVCGKTEEEWDRWWDLMLANASTADCYDTGDCLVIGSWLCRKIVIENPQIIVI